MTDLNKKIPPKGFDEPIIADKTPEEGFEVPLFQKKQVIKPKDQTIIKKPNLPTGRGGSFPWKYLPWRSNPDRDFSILSWYHSRAEGRFPSSCHPWRIITG